MKTKGYKNRGQEAGAGGGLGEVGEGREKVMGVND